MTLVASESRPVRSSATFGMARKTDRQPIGRWMLASPLYSLTLGRSPRSFFAVAPDQWPGDPTLGQRLLVGELVAHGITGAVTPGDHDSPWRRADANPLWLAALNGFSWLRDLRDCGEPGTAQLAVRL